MKHEPAKIVEESGTAFSIEWTDGITTRYQAVDLRRNCPCAGCVDEWTGQRTLNQKTVADDMSFTHTSIVGRYALNFHFSDGHETGIYSFKYLRDLAEETE